jgi:hypothetical protein
VCAYVYGRAVRIKKAGERGKAEQSEDQDREEHESAKGDEEPSENK